jgi:DNA-binding CsgD family transcriptional regulator
MRPSAHTRTSPIGLPNCSRRTVETVVQLTAQEAHIAKLAVEGKTNAEIAARLYVSPRTVEWHMSKVFTKLGINSSAASAVWASTRASGAPTQ